MMGVIFHISGAMSRHRGSLRSWSPSKSPCSDDLVSGILYTLFQDAGQRQTSEQGTTVISPTTETEQNSIEGEESIEETEYGESTGRPDCISSISSRWENFSVGRKSVGS